MPRHFLDGLRPFRTRTLLEWAAWFASRVGLADPIAYHVIGGLARARGGFVSKDIPLPLSGRLQTACTDHESFFLLLNLTLTGEALRL